MKNKINPLIVYYNKAIFRSLNLEEPSADWSWDQLDNTVVQLLSSGKKVYFPMTPMSLEWLTVNRYGGRIVDAGATVFSGYLDSEEAVQAAEWLRTYQTPWDDYGSNDGYYPMLKIMKNRGSKRLLQWYKLRENYYSKQWMIFKKKLLKQWQLLMSPLFEHDLISTINRTKAANFMINLHHRIVTPAAYKYLMLKSVFLY